MIKQVAMEILLMIQLKPKKTHEIFTPLVNITYMGVHHLFNLFDCHNQLLVGEGRIGTDENVFVDVFGFAAQCRRQTSEMFQMYKKISGKTIEQALKSEMSGDLLHGLKDIGMSPVIDFRSRSQNPL